MLLQLGNKIFEGLFAPSGWNYSGNEANLAQYALINTKPRLQHTGLTLEEVSLSFKLRVEYCNPDREIKDLEEWKKKGTILPLLLGNGEYVNDYVLKSISKTITQTFDDGSIVEANISLNLLEFVPEDPEAQQSNADRRNAAAVGDKKQVVRKETEKSTPEAIAHQSLMTAENKAWKVANEANKMKGASNPEKHIGKVKGIIKRAQKAMSDTREKVTHLQQKINNATGIIASVNQAKDKLTEIDNLMQPPISTQSLNNSILNLQTSISGLNSSATLFTTDTILRKI